jgi:hypothetical protein
MSPIRTRALPGKLFFSRYATLDPRPKAAPIFSYLLCRNAPISPVTYIEAAWAVKLAAREVDDVPLLFSDDHGNYCCQRGFYGRPGDFGLQIVSQEERSSGNGSGCS